MVILRTYAIVPIAWTCATWCCSVGMGSDSMIKPDPMIQSKISAVSEAIKHAGDESGEGKACRAVTALQRAVAKNEIELVRQLIWHHAQATDVAEGMTLTMVLHFCNVSKQVMVNAVAPLVGRTQDPKLERGITEVIDLVEACDVQQGCDFSYYQSYIDGRLRNGSDLDMGLVQHMFRRSPGQALQAFTLVVYLNDQRKPFLWSRHVVDDLLWKRQFGFVKPSQPDAAVTQEIATMAGRDEWWARAYAAAIVAKYPELGTPEIVEQLKADKNEPVRDLLKADRS